MDFCMGMAKQFMLKKVEEGLDKNLVLSPLSINAVLNMLAAGSKGPSLEHMLGYLGSNNITEINSNSSEMMAVVYGAAGSSKKRKRKSEDADAPVLSMINGVWVDKCFPVKPSYQKLLKGTYSCEAKSVDFVNEADKVISEVNSWAKAASKGRITNILPQRSLTPDTTLILANALYFKGKWDDRFNAKCTKKGDFYLLNGKTVSVPFMTNGGLHLYRSFDGFKVLQIPYRSGTSDRQFSMFFFLPDERDGLQKLLHQFNSDPGFLQQKKYFNLKREYLDAGFLIPKFKFSFGFDASKAMRDLGAKLPSLEKMVHNPKGLPFLVSNMIQKAFIEIDENGTEASAVTLGILSRSALRKRNNLSFVADHPFMFMIKEEASGLVFFTGAILNPKISG